MIKNIFWLILLSLFLGACNGDDTVELAEIPFRIEFEIPAGLNVVEDHFFEIKNVTNITEQILEGRGVDIESASVIQPKVVRMTVLFDDTPLSFIDECSISLFSDILNRKSEAFWTPQIPFNQGNNLDVPGTLIDAKDYLLEDKLNFEVRFDTRSINSQFINIRLDISFSVRG